MPRPSAVLAAVIDQAVSHLAIDNPGAEPSWLARETQGVIAEIMADWRSYRSRREAAKVFAAHLAMGGV